MGMYPLRQTSHVTSHLINYLLRSRRIDMNHHAEDPSTAHNEHGRSQHGKHDVATSSAPANERARHSATSLTATQRLNDKRTKSFIVFVVGEQSMLTARPPPIVINTRTWCHVATGRHGNQTTNDDRGHRSSLWYIL